MSDIFQDNEARMNVTYDGANGDLPDPVPFDASKDSLRQMATEAIRGGDIPGIPTHDSPDLDGFEVDYFAADEEVDHNRVFIRPKTPYGGRR